jgi:hypothetical protein
MKIFIKADNATRAFNIVHLSGWMRIYFISYCNYLNYSDIWSIVR